MKTFAPSGAGRDRPFGFLARFAPLIFLLVLMAVFAIVEPRFLTPLNLFNVMRQVSIVGLLAIGMTFVILTAGIDLSVGSLARLCRPGRRRRRQGRPRQPLHRRRRARTRRLRLAPRGARRDRRRHRRRLAAGLRHHPAEGAALRRHARRHVGLPRRSRCYFAGGGPISGFDQAYAGGARAMIGPVPVPVIIFLAFAVLAHIVLR